MPGAVRAVCGSIQLPPLKTVLRGSTPPGDASRVRRRVHGGRREKGRENPKCQKNLELVFFPPLSFPPSFCAAAFCAADSGCARPLPLPFLGPRNRVQERGGVLLCETPVKRRHERDVSVRVWRLLSPCKSLSLASRPSGRPIAVTLTERESLSGDGWPSGR